MIDVKKIQLKLDKVNLNNKIVQNQQIISKAEDLLLQYREMVAQLRKDKKNLEFKVKMLEDTLEDIPKIIQKIFIKKPKKMLSK